MKTKERGSTRNPVAVDWENREVHELGAQYLHFSDSILGLLDVILRRIRAY